jgi:hypothetical protein
VLCYTAYGVARAFTQRSYPTGDIAFVALLIPVAAASAIVAIVYPPRRVSQTRIRLTHDRLFADQEQLVSRALAKPRDHRVFADDLKNGAEERIRTSTRLPGLAPEASASAVPPLPQVVICVLPC